MSHYDCSRCGAYLCTPSRCRAEDERRAQAQLEKEIRLQLCKGDIALLERAVHVIELTLPETTYAKGMVLAELLENIKKRLE